MEQFLIGLILLILGGLALYLICLLYFENRRLKKDRFKIGTQNDLSAYCKKGIYLKLVTIIENARFDSQNKQVLEQIQVYGFEVGKLKLMGFVSEKKYHHDPIHERIFFDLPYNTFPSANPQEYFIYSVKDRGHQNNPNRYILVAEKHMKNVPNAGTLAS